MKSVYLDYTKPAQTPLTAWLLFASGVLLVVVMWIFFQQAQARNAELQTKLASSTVPIVAPIVSDSPQIKKDIEAVNNAIHDIVIPWVALWKALETANVDGVNMLALEPNAKTHMERLNLVALNHAVMWAYLQNLNQQAALRNVRLISSEATEVNGQHAVAFLVEATWSI